MTSFGLFDIDFSQTNETSAIFIHNQSVYSLYATPFYIMICSMWMEPTDVNICLRDIYIGEVEAKLHN